MHSGIRANRPPTIISSTSAGRKQFLRLLSSSVLLTLAFALLYFYSPQSFSFVNLRTIDIIQATAVPSESDINVVIVAIDEASLRTYGQWPWPRYRLARLLQKITTGGAASIGVNIVFPEKDRTSPKNWQENIARDFGFTIATTNIPAEILDHDAFLADILKQGPFVMAYSFLFDQTSPSTVCDLKPAALSSAPDVPPLGSALRLHQASDVLCNTEVISGCPNRAGFLNGTPDRDGILRRMPLLIEMDGLIYPSFALSVLMQFKRHDVIGFSKNLLDIPLLHMAGLYLPSDNYGNYLLGPPSPSQETAIPLSAAEILEGKTDLSVFKDKIVLVGLTASGTTSEYATQLGPATPLLLLQKFTIESLGSSRHTIRTKMFIVFEIVFSLVAVLILVLATYHLPTMRILLVGLFTLAACWVTAILLYHHSGYLFSPLLPSITIVFNCGLLFTMKSSYFQQQARSDITQAIQLVKSSESQLKSIMRTIPDIIFRLDRNGKITFISPAVAKYLQSPQAILGRSIFDLVAPEDLDKAKFRVNERRTGERATHDLEIRLVFDQLPDTPPEDLRYFSVSAEGIYTGDAPNPDEFVGTQGIVKDITDRKRLEDKLVQAQKMEVIGNLAAGIAHDLNNILSGLVSYPDLLLLELDKDDPLYGKIVVIQKSGKRAAAIVQDLLALARRSVKIDEVCNMNNIISDFIQSLEFEKIISRHPDIIVRTELQSDLMNVRGSAVHLSKVIMNTLTNSLEAMPAGGEIVISTTNAYNDNHIQHYETIPEGEYVCTTVADNGIGIRNDDLKRIFEPFYTKKSMARSGTGLGMTVIWATVKDHSGYIHIDSEEGVGTTLTIYLPSTRDHAEQLHKRIVLDDYVGTETILVIDDIAEQLEIARGMLEKLGYRVLTASSGENGISLLREQTVDLVILDMIMPGGLDGLETYRHIVRQIPHQKAIITSGFSESDRVKELQSLGAGLYVQKPYSMECLGMAIRGELDRKEAENK